MDGAPAEGEFTRIMASMPHQSQKGGAWSQYKSKDKEREQGKGKKLTFKKEAVKDLETRKDVRAGAAARTLDMRHATNHNETLVLDP
jgi:hypothetical protein